jgi:hypothetical protein
MPIAKRSYSLDPAAVEFVERRAKRLRRSASSVLSDLIAEAAQQEARDRVLGEFGADAAIPEREVKRWLRKLGAA